MGSWVGIIPGSEVSIEGCDNGILLSFLHILPKERQYTKCFDVFCLIHIIQRLFHLAGFKSESCIRSSVAPESIKSNMLKI